MQKSLRIVSLLILSLFAVSLLVFATWPRTSTEVARPVSLFVPRVDHFVPLLVNPSLKFESLELTKLLEIGRASCRERVLMPV